MPSELESSARQNSKVQLRLPRVAEAVAAMLRKRIIDGELDDGDELPTESVMLSEYPASRPSLREAIRILETEGLVSVRRGKRGGTIVRRPTAATAAYHMGLLLHSQQTPTTDLAAARNLLEPLCAEQAAMRPDHAAVGAELREVNDRARQVVDDGPNFTDAAIEFHEALVAAAGNATLRVITGMLESVWSVQERDWARDASEVKAYPGIELRHEVLRVHEAISEAIGAGDPDVAARVTKKHLHAAQLYVASDETQSVRILDGYGSPSL